MKTKFFWLALLVSAALIGPVQAGGHHGGSRGGGRSFAGGRSISSHGGYHRSSPMRGYSGGARYSRIYPSYYARHSTAFRQPYVYSRRSTFGNLNRFSPQHYNGAKHLVRSGNSSHFTRSRTGNFTRRNGATQNRTSRAGQPRHGNNLRPNWQNHVYARHSANWHHNWDHHHDHWWHGHRCSFIGGSWVVFDLGFYPWWPWPYWYPYGSYYGNPYAYYGGYPYGYYGGYGYPYGYDSGYYDPGAYQGDQGGQYYYYDQNGDQNGDAQPYDQNGDSSVAVLQERLAREGYYHGQIDGIMGPEARRALADYRRDHGEPPNGGHSGQNGEPSPSN